MSDAVTVIGSRADEHDLSGFLDDAAIVGGDRRIENGLPVLL